ncbi:MAG: DegV family protein [Coriobacteriia bacterium]
MPTNEKPQRRFAIITDSSSDISPELSRRLDIEVIPLVVTIDGETLADGTLSQEEFFDRMNVASELPKTSQPNVGAFVDAYARALATVESVISIHISSGLSGTLESARTAAQEFGDRVHVFDSRNLSWGLAWQVIDAVAAAGEGLGVAETLERLERTRGRVKIIVTLDSLENLRRGGRIGAVSSFLGSALNLKVTVIVGPEGTFTPVRGSRGDRAAIEYMLTWVAKQMGTARSGRFAVGHAMSARTAERLATRIRETWDVTELVMYEAGPVIAAHAGTIWGVTVWPDE